MSLASHDIFTKDSVQEQLRCYTLAELKSHLEYLIKSFKEVQIDIININKHIEELTEALNARK